jgi:hypothetical protein
MDALFKYWSTSTGIYIASISYTFQIFWKFFWKFLIPIHFSELKNSKKTDPCITPVLKPPPYWRGYRGGIPGKHTIPLHICKQTLNI